MEETVMLPELKATLSQLANKDFLHVISEPFLFWGTLLGVLGYGLARWWLRDGRVQFLSLMLVVVASAAVWPVVKWGPKGAKATPALEEVRKLHEKHHWVHVAPGAVALLCYFLRDRKPLGDMCGVVLVVGGLGAAIFALWLYEKSVRVHHPAVRPERSDPKISLVF
jgi:hypothetical protein